MLWTNEIAAFIGSTKFKNEGAKKYDKQEMICMLIHDRIVGHITFLDFGGSKMPRKSIYLAIGIFVIIGAFVAMSVHFFAWKTLNDIDECRELVENHITEITLREAIDTPVSVTFDDRDLVVEWETFFKQLEVKRNVEIPLPKRGTNGGKPIAQIKTKSKDFCLCFPSGFDGNRVIINDRCYQFKSETVVPFENTYRRAMKRYS